MQQALKVNSIDYLLEPLDEEELQAALEKFRKLNHTNAAASPQLGALEQAMQLLSGKKNYKSHYVVKVGEHLHMIPMEEVVSFYSFEKATFLQCSSGKRYAIDYTLEQLEQLVNPDVFFPGKPRLPHQFKSYQRYYYLV